ncbi:hypothetical protein Sgleb_24720 [Streptomyces glebosus]|uniref:Uncharacterized protein n=1 Tax=Streptomyces glebosus TaxID=249580 RepID=A0A640SYD7_9ACTN|nr:hypothetical protein Sgleb_24720 [Streptomyces glebosus]GHG55417.1 hypothetical protein GCM10010513_17550 [Streptomyces glebosus]
MSASQEVPAPPPRPKAKIRVFRANRYGQIFVREELAEDRTAAIDAKPSGAQVPKQGQSQVVAHAHEKGRYTAE